ncbi:MAG TPA: type VI secretion system accessory protein TagJ [Candidatus Koribacter sp.]
MTAKELFQAGKLNEAIDALGAELRSNPTDSQRRTFLFELLCFAGLYDRADKQLDILAQGGRNAELGSLVYRSALNAEKARQEFFRKKDYELRAAAPVATMAGSINGKPFTSFEDADPRIGRRLEFFLGGAYMWMALSDVASLTLEAPKRLRDLLWAPAILKPAAGFRGIELGEVLLPVTTVFSFEAEEDSVRLGRETAWIEDESGKEIPLGQKMFLIDGEEVPLLELRSLELNSVNAAAS